MPSLTCAHVHRTFRETEAGSSDPADSPAVAGHLAVCPQCRELRERMLWLERLLCDPADAEPAAGSEADAAMIDTVPDLTLPVIGAGPDTAVLADAPPVPAPDPWAFWVLAGES